MDYFYAILAGIVSVIFLATYFKQSKLFSCSAEKMRKVGLDEQYVDGATDEVSIGKDKGDDAFSQETIADEIILSKSGSRSAGQYKVQLKGITTVCVLGVLTSVLAYLITRDISNFANFSKLSFLLILITASAVVDFKKRIIPNTLIAIGIVVRVVIYIVEFIFFRDQFKLTLISDLIGFALGFGIFFIAAVISRGAVGYGDVKLFGIIGLYSGIVCTYSTIIFSLIATTVLSVVLLIIRKKNKKDSIPMAPCILIGYIVSIILSNY